MGGVCEQQMQGLKVEWATDSALLVESTANVTFENLILANNTATSGGALVVRSGGTASIRNSLVTLGNATGATGGGGIAVSSAKLRFGQGVEVSRCFANGSPATGGGVACDACDIAPISGEERTATMLLTRNTASHGGNLVVRGTSSLAGLTVTHGTADVGGGLAVEANADVTMNAIYVASNAATLDTNIGGTGVGGGMHVATNARVRSAASAATGLTLTDNEAVFGGGLAVATGALVSGSIRSVDNRACSQGGGAHMEGGGALSDLLIDANCAGCCLPAAPDAAIGGGGVSASGGAATLTNVTVTANVAHDGASYDGRGGGVTVVNAATLSLHTSTVSDNNVFGHGGGVAVADTSAVVVTSASHVLRNVAVGCGGGIALWDSAAVTGLAVRDNAAAAIPASDSGRPHGGGGICAMSGSVSARDMTVTRNAAATSGGGATVRPFVRLTVTDSSMTENVAGLDGGGVWVMTRADAHGNGWLVRENVAAGSGGGIACTRCASLSRLNVTANVAAFGGGLAFENAPSASTPTVAGHVFTDANVATVSGGGAFLHRHARVHLSTSTLSGNVATVFGGGVYALDSTLGHGEQVLVEGNSATNGAGLALNSSVVLRADDSVASEIVVRGNTAQQNGGGVHMSTSWQRPCSIAHAGIHDNAAASATGGGGGMYVGSVSSPGAMPPAWVNHTVISTCTATNGAGLFIAGVATTMGEVSVRSTLANTNGGGVMAMDANIVAESCSFTATNALHGGALYVQDSSFVAIDTAATSTAATGTGGAAVTTATYTGSTTRLSGLHMMECTAPAGGGLWSTSVPDSKCVVTYLLAEACSATGDIGGGGVAAVGGSLEASWLRLHGNIAVAVGGALAAHGGAIVTVTDSAVLNNWAHAQGGAFFMSSCDVTVDRSSLEGNRALSDTAQGGVVYASASTLAMDECTLDVGEFNGTTVANEGGAMYITDMAAGGVTIRATTATGFVANRGGTLFVRASDIALHDSVLAASTAVELGGCMYIESLTSLLAVGSRFASCFSTFEGGVMYGQDASAVVRDSHLTVSQAYSGAAAYVGSNMALRVESSLVDRNAAEFVGGGIYVHRRGQLNATRSTIARNTASDGGGLFLTDARGNHMHRVVVSRNQADGRGGGFMVSKRSSVTLSSSIVGNNTATIGGGMWLAGDSLLDVVDCAVELNNATSDGGGVAVFGNSSLLSTGVKFRNVVVQRNRAAARGGGGMFDSGPSMLYTSLLRRNEAMDGGGVFMNQAALLHAEQVVWSANSATHGGGALLFNDDLGIVPTDSSAGNGTNVTDILASGSLSAAANPNVHLWPQALTWTSCAVVNNTAQAGGALYWRLKLPRVGPLLPLCSNCTLQHNSMPQNASSGMRVASLPETAPVTDVVVRSGSAWGRSIETIAERPRSAVLDLWHQTAPLDNTTQCVMTMHNNTDVEAFIPNAPLSAQFGVVDLDSLFVNSEIDSTMDLLFTCTVVSDLDATQHVNEFDIHVRVRTCTPGWDLSKTKVCTRCLPGQYSPLGIHCSPCPGAGNCSATVAVDDGSAVASIVSVGTDFPEETPGFWLGPARQSIVDSAQCLGLKEGRKHPVTGRDICPPGEVVSGMRADGSYECATSSDATADLLYACFLEMELYACPLEEACLGGAKDVHPVDGSDEPPIATAAERNLMERDGTCLPGHTGIMCAKCQPGYISGENTVCSKCPDATVLLLVLLVLFIVILVLLWNFLVSGSLVKRAKEWLADRHAKAMGRERTAFDEHERARSMRETLSLPGTIWAFGVNVAGKPEKLLLFMSFFQVVYSMRANYTTMWPPTMSDTMEAAGVFNLNLVSLTSVRCVSPSITFYHEFVGMTTLPMFALLFVLAAFAYRRRQLNEAIRYAKCCSHASVLLLSRSYHLLLTRSVRCVVSRMTGLDECVWDLMQGGKEARQRLRTARAQEKELMAKKIAPVRLKTLSRGVTGILQTIGRRRRAARESNAVSAFMSPSQRAQAKYGAAKGGGQEGLDMLADGKVEEKDVPSNGGMKPMPSTRSVYDDMEDDDPAARVFAEVTRSLRMTDKERQRRLLKSGRRLSQIRPPKKRSGVMKIRRAVNRVRNVNRTTKKSKRSVRTKDMPIWTLFHKKGNNEAEMLDDGQSICACVEGHPMQGYVLR